MIHAYSELYIDDAMRNMGEMIEYAHDLCNEDMDAFLQTFIISGYADRWEHGDPAVLCGMSGTELHHAVWRKCLGYGFREDPSGVGACGQLEENWPPAAVRFDTGESYWCGYMLALFQWERSLPFAEILTDLPYREWQRLYPTLHTASEGKCLEALSEQAAARRQRTRLQAYRRRLGISQKELARQSGVNLRTLQEYEVRDKDIRQAASEKVIALAAVLGCSPASLLE